MKKMMLFAVTLMFSFSAFAQDEASAADVGRIGGSKAALKALRKVQGSTGELMITVDPLGANESSGLIVMLTVPRQGNALPVCFQAVYLVPKGSPIDFAHVERYLDFSQVECQ